MSTILFIGLTPASKSLSCIQLGDGSTLTSNRPDCLSMIGMARETAATLGTSYKMPNFNYEVKSSKNINDELKVEVKDELCRRYMVQP